LRRRPARRSIAHHSRPARPKQVCSQPQTPARSPRGRARRRASPPHPTPACGGGVARSATGGGVLLTPSARHAPSPGLHLAAARCSPPLPRGEREEARQLAGHPEKA
jgi:hypothetical protein